MKIDSDRTLKIERWKKRIGLFASIDYKISNGLRTVVGVVVNVSDDGIILIRDIRQSTKETEVNVDYIINSTVEEVRKI